MNEKKLEWQIAIGAAITAAVCVACAVMALASTFWGWIP